MTLLSNHVSKFLVKNGYKKEGIAFVTDECTIIIYDDYFSINHDGIITDSDDHCIYWLIGYLVYNDLIDRNFKI